MGRGGACAVGVATTVQQHHSNNNHPDADWWCGAAQALRQEKAQKSEASGARDMAISDITPAPGVLLVAPPMLHDPNFWRSVILLCEHGEEGSFGLILNSACSR